MKKLFALTISVLFIVQLKAQEYTSNSKLTTEECEELVQFRDVQLIKIWDKTISNYRISEKQIADLNKYKEQLSDDTWYATTNLHVVTLTLKLASNTVEDILNIVAPVKAATVNLMLTVTGFKFLDYDTKRRDILASDDIIKSTAKLMAKEVAGLTPFGAIPNMLDNLSENLHTLDDYANVQSEVTLQLKNFEKAIKNFNLKLNSVQSDLVEINQYKSYIDRYLNENCKVITAPAVVTSGKKVNTLTVKTQLFATYKNENGQWVAMGPYNSSKAYPTEKQAMAELLYAPPVLVFLCERGKYNIYKINEKTENVRKNVRDALTQLGVKDIPE